MGKLRELLELVGRKGEALRTIRERKVSSSNSSRTISGRTRREMAEKVAKTKVAKREAAKTTRTNRMTLMEVAKMAKP